MSFDQSIIEPLGLTEPMLVQQLSKDVLDVFSTMVGMDSLSHTPILIDPVTHFENGVTAMVGFAGTYNSVVSIHTPHQLALTFGSNMMGMEITEFDDDISDALGEIANMIAGSLKQQLSHGGADIKLSTPSVITGRKYSVSTGSTADTLTLKFAVNAESFLVSATLKKE